jgi:hypothetical protein
MSIIRLLAPAVSALFIAQVAGCGEDGPPTAGTLVTFDTVCDRSNVDKRVALEGYLDFPEQFKSRDVTVMMRLRAAPFAKDKVVGASVRLGTGPNHVALPPKSYTARDVKVTTNDGETVGYTDKVRVSGTMYYPGAIANVEFKCGLSNTLIESIVSSGK